MLARVRCAMGGASVPVVASIRQPLLRAHAVQSSAMQRHALGSSQRLVAGKAAAAPAVGGDGSEQSEKSLRYSKDMQARMGTQDSYQHELGLNYNRILDDLIVGSCLQEADDVNHLVEQENVKVVYCLQEDSDMAYFNLDIKPVEARCAELGIKHIRFRIRDFDPHDLRARLPDAVRALVAAHDPSSGTAYIHCTAGMGRAPAVAVAYMAWARGMQVDDAHEQVTTTRRCSPRMESIRWATADLLLGLSTVPVTMAVYRTGGASEVQVAGLDFGWHKKLDLTRNAKKWRFELTREMRPGTYQYKYIFDGAWTYSADHPTVKDYDNINNKMEVVAALSDDTRRKLESMLTKGSELTQEEKAALTSMVNAA
ncbi:hypothetical protein FOA52_003508 [Chlamydomonas sp. UWO 241]|nr:hypothetical protein FOA52_003508 [Chlamydomonas sp. UWO 241]